MRGIVEPGKNRHCRITKSFSHSCQPSIDPDFKWSDSAIIAERNPAAGYTNAKSHITS